MIGKQYVYNDNNFSLNYNYNEHATNVDTHIHNCYEIYYYISGNLTYHVEGQSYKLNKNDIIITNARELHRIVFDSQSVYERKFIQFKPEYVSAFQNEGYHILDFLDKRKLGHHNKIAAEDVVSNGIDLMWQKIEKIYAEKTAESEILVKAIFVQMLIEIKKIFAKNNDVLIDSIEYDEKIIEVLNYINENIEEKINLVDLEKTFHLSKYYLCHLFKKNTGFSIVEYIIYKRIIKAEELILSGMPIIQVSNEVGFGDYTNFYKAFKKISGVSPHKYINI